MIFGMGPLEIGVILLVVLVIFGPKNLPKLGSAIGKTVKNVREGMEGDDELDAAPDEVPVAEPQVSRAVSESGEKDDETA
ncbi:twin-arginine translocase TatA/TatE family subunit [Olsenella profusa]|uniref:Sec-independent protein translocase protein TatA n=1 Tax=Olsenella profusa TaxID=138595 RepID=A0ABS2F3W3_9ACTN|nr:twin-arginine translocase TatA/TatE family subunit [Olsenella profusa]MBM6775507.1 twin-arginine translocase TatA/TatE family subunit [Olsenella profusa]